MRASLRDSVAAVAVDVVVVTVRALALHGRCKGVVVSLQAPMGLGVELCLKR